MTHDCINYYIRNDIRNRVCKLLEEKCSQTKSQQPKYNEDQDCFYNLKSFQIILGGVQ